MFFAMSLQTSLDVEHAKSQSQLQQKEAEISQLRTDLDHLKGKLVQLLR